MYDSEHQPTVEELDGIHRFFLRMAGEAGARGWEDLYLDMAHVAQDVVAAWRGEFDPNDY